MRPNHVDKIIRKGAGMLEFDNFLCTGESRWLVPRRVRPS
jgi:hypothetical protein